MNVKAKQDGTAFQSQRLRKCDFLTDDYLIY